MGYRVLIHIDEAEKWPLALGNARNLLEAAAEPVDLRIIANGRAVLTFASGEHREAMAGLQEQGVRIQACRNALKALRVEEQSLPEGVEVVPAGVLELVERQREGFAYLRP
nr:DsrE family protein [uncultured Holophaga sp.]